MKPKETKEKACEICKEPYTELICPKCGHNVFVFWGTTDILMRFCKDKYGTVSGAWAVGRHLMDGGEGYKCQACGETIDIGSHAYSWHGITEIEEAPMDWLVHRPGWRGQKGE